MNLIHKTKTWLLDNNILVPDDWVSACIEWIQEEHQGVPQTQEQINSLVYEQWLLADLHDLETRCLPASILTADKFQLSGNYALQIDSILDVGQSFYSQQQKVRGTENANVGVSAEEQTLKPWEQKPTRMLMFKLTDGSQTVQGMEYKPISCLNPHTQPGSKILVHGSLLCRHGVLMLCENNIQFLGGEVDTLVEANTPLNVLESAMEASTEHAGKSHRQEYEGSEVRHTQQPNTKPVAQRFSSQQKFGQATKTMNQSQCLKTVGSVKKEITEVKVQQTSNYIDDQWEDDQMYNALMDDMEMDDFEQPQISHPNQSRADTKVSRETFSKQGNNMGPRGAAGSVQPSGNNRNIYMSRGDKRKGVLSGSELNVKREIGVIIPKREVNTCDEASNLRKTDLNSLPLKRPKTTASSVAFNDDGFDEDMDFSEINELEQMGIETAAEHNVGERNKMFSANGNTSYPATDQSSTCVNSSKSTLTASKLSASDLHLSNLKTESVPVSLKSKANLSSSAVLKRGAHNVQNQRNSITRETTCTDRVFSSSKIPSSCVSSNPGMSSNYGSDASDDYPFTYLSKVLSQQPAEMKIVTVKAYISTLTSKLSSDLGKWSLSCKINDGTMACDVDLSDKVLTDLIGFSTEDAKIMKLRAKTDKSVREALHKGIQTCQQKLVQLMCLMKVDVSIKNSKPVVVAIKDVTANDINLLYNRVMSSRSGFLS